MASLNKVLLMGNLTRDPDVRYVPSGAAVAEFSMAMNRVYTNQAKERKEEVCYVKIVTWGKLAENCSKYLTKGSPVFVEGRLQSRSWETKDGEKRNILEVVADRVQFLSSRPKTEGAQKETADMVSSTDVVPDASSDLDDVPF